MMFWLGEVPVILVFAVVNYVLIRPLEWCWQQIEPLFA
jgi:hypothetical protein